MKKDTTPLPVRPYILLAEDEFGLRTIIASELRNHGFNVCEVACAEEALAPQNGALSKFEFASVILTDLHMPQPDGKPGIGGLGLLEKNRERELKVPILVLSNMFGHGPFPSERTLKENFGASETIYKPPDIDMLIESIKKYWP